MVCSRDSNLTLPILTAWAFAAVLTLGAPAAAQPADAPAAADPFAGAEAPFRVDASAPPPFRGEPVHEGAWSAERAWADPAGGDARNGSYAYAYRAWARERADRHVDQGTRLDCADLSIALLCEYAARNALPVRWRVYYPPERRYVEVTQADAQFDSPASFLRWSLHFLGAINLADDTDAISYDEWAGGDMVLMDWNQSDEAPNFEGRVVWHTYLIGAPNEVIYYGNISDGEALPVSRVTEGSRMDMVREHPDRYGASPRRFRLFRGAVWAPRHEEATVQASRLNLRAGPGTGHAVVRQARRGETLVVAGEEGPWVRLALADGSEVWAHGLFLSREAVEPDRDARGLVDALALGEPR